MPNIILIDDDYASEVIKEGLELAGFKCSRVVSASAAFDSIEELAKADLIILDIIMERPADQSSISGGMNTGVSIFHALRAKNPGLPILVFSGTSDKALTENFSGTPNTIFLSKWSSQVSKTCFGT